MNNPVSLIDPTGGMTNGTPSWTPGKGHAHKYRVDAYWKM